MTDFTGAFDFPGGDELRRALHLHGPAQAYLVAATADAPVLDALAASAVCSAPSGRPCGRCPHCRKALAGIHPDIQRFTREKDRRQFSVDAVRRMRSEAYVIPTEAAGKAFIAEGADTMNPSAQNALLKVLEEPPAGTVFLLQCENPGRFLETIRSRCVLVDCAARGGGIPMEAEGREYARLCAEGAGTELARFLIRTVQPLDREGLEAFLRSARAALTASMASAEAAAGERLSRAECAVSEAGRYLEANVSAGHIAGLLLAEGAEMRKPT